MTKNLIAYAHSKGYQIIKTRKCIYSQLFGYIWLPLWLTFDTEFKSKKGSRYTMEGFIFKLKRKRERKRKKREMAKQFNKAI